MVDSVSFTVAVAVALVEKGLLPPYGLSRSGPLCAPFRGGRFSEAGKGWLGGDRISRPDGI